MDSDPEKDLEAAFREDPDFGISVLHETHRNVIVSCIKANGLGLKPADIDDVYGQTMLELLLAARKPDFDYVAPLRLAKTIAKRRASDARKRRGFNVRTEGIEYQDQIIEDLHGTKVGLRAKFDIVDYDEFDAVLRAKIETLPHMQQIAAICFIDMYKEIRKVSYGVLAEAMSDVLGEPVTVAAAKSAWYEAQEKIVEHLRRHGFDLWGDES